MGGPHPAASTERRPPGVRTKGLPQMTRRGAYLTPIGRSLA
jgi:hypothetical protein